MNKEVLKRLEGIEKQLEINKIVILIDGIDDPTPYIEKGEEIIYIDARWDDIPPQEQLDKMQE